MLTNTWTHSSFILHLKPWDWFALSSSTNPPSIHAHCLHISMKTPSLSSYSQLAPTHQENTSILQTVQSILNHIFSPCTFFISKLVFPQEFAPRVLSMLHTQPPPRSPINLRSFTLLLHLLLHASIPPRLHKVPRRPRATKAYNTHIPSTKFSSVKSQTLRSPLTTK